METTHCVGSFESLLLVDEALTPRRTVIPQSPSKRGQVSLMRVCPVRAECRSLTEESSIVHHLRTKHQTDEYILELDEEGKSAMLEVEAPIVLNSSKTERTCLLLKFRESIFLWMLESKKRGDGEVQITVSVQTLAVNPPLPGTMSGPASPSSSSQGFRSPSHASSSSRNSPTNFRLPSPFGDPYANFECSGADRDTPTTAPRLVSSGSNKTPVGGGGSGDGSGGSRSPGGMPPRPPPLSPFTLASSLRQSPPRTPSPPLQPQSSSSSRHNLINQHSSSSPLPPNIVLTAVTSVGGGGGGGVAVGGGSSMVMVPASTPASPTPTLSPSRDLTRVQIKVNRKKQERRPLEWKGSIAQPTRSGRSDSSTSNASTTSNTSTSTTSATTSTGSTSAALETGGGGCSSCPPGVVMHDDDVACPHDKLVSHGECLLVLWPTDEDAFISPTPAAAAAAAAALQHNNNINKTSPGSPPPHVVSLVVKAKFW